MKLLISFPARIILLFILINCSAQAQFKPLSQLGKALKKNKATNQLLEGSPAISTCFNDVNTEGALQPSFGDDKTYIELKSLKRNEKGNYVLDPGFYEGLKLSYCLKVGTPGPAKGNVYGLAFLDGKMEDIVYAIIDKSQKIWMQKSADSSGQHVATGNLLHTSVGQKDVQLLLWAIIAKADFSNMPLRMKAVASALLTPEQLLKLNGGAIKTVSNFAMDKGFLEKPEALRKIEEAQQAIRQLWSSGNFEYEQMENLALLAGIVHEADPLPADMWFKHENGYYVRFKPMGYPRTLTQIYVPEGLKAEFIATGTVATPTDSRQRLAQTDILAEYYEALGLH